MPAAPQQAAHDADETSGARLVVARDPCAYEHSWLPQKVQRAASRQPRRHEVCRLRPDAYGYRQGKYSPRVGDHPVRTPLVAVPSQAGGFGPSLATRHECGGSEWNVCLGCPPASSRETASARRPLQMSDSRVARVGAGELLAHDGRAELAGDRFGLAVHTAGDGRRRRTMAQVAAATTRCRSPTSVGCFAIVTRKPFRLTEACAASGPSLNAGPAAVAGAWSAP